MGSLTRAAIALALVASTFAFAKQSTCADLLAALAGVDKAVARSTATDIRTNAETALDAAAKTPEALIDFVGRDLGLQHLLDKKASPNGTETVGQHTLEVLRNFNDLNRVLDLNSLDVSTVTQRPIDLMRATLALHDIGKGLAIEKGEPGKQHEYTVPLLEKALAAAGFTPKEIALAKALVDNDTIGLLARGQITEADAQKQIEELAGAAGVNTADFYKLQMAFWMADARSHANLRNKIFEEVGDGTLRPKSNAVTALGAKLGVGTLWKDASKLAFEKALETVRQINDTPAGTELNYGQVFDFIESNKGLDSRDKRYADFHREVLKMFSRLAQPENAKVRESLAHFGLDFTANTFDSSTLAYLPAVAKLQGNIPGVGGQTGALTQKQIDAAPGDFVVFYHGTTATGAKAVLKDGIDLERGDGEFGRGFYLTSSPGQAKAWATIQADNKDKPVVLRVVVRKSELMKLYGDGAMIDFDYNTSRKDGEAMQKAFDVFVAGNRTLRKMAPERTQYSRDLFDNVDVVSGPSVSNRGQVFDQFKFGGTDRTKKLFDASSPDMRLDAIDVP